MKMLTDEELVNAIEHNPESTPTELELADRLARAMEAIADLQGRYEYLCQCLDQHGVRYE